MIGKRKLMKKNKTVTVIIPFYNAKKFLKKSIESVLNQTYSNLDIILVDDCSNDGSVKIVKKFIKKDNRIRLFKTNKNSGTVGVPRNIGIKHARGDYVTFLDADDYWHHDKINYQLSKIKKNILIATAGRFEVYKTKKNNFFTDFLRIFFQRFIFNKIKNKGFCWLYIYNPVIVSSIMIKKKIFNQVNMFSSDPNIREDLSMWLKVFRIIKDKFLYSTKKTITITQSSNSMSSNKLEEFSKVIRTMVTDLLNEKNFNNLHYIILGIIFRSLKFLIVNFFYKIKKNVIKLVITILFLYYVIFYSPLFVYVGNFLVKYDKPPLNTVTHLVSLSGTKNEGYFGLTLKFRLNDIVQNYNESIKKIFLFGELKDIPNQIILKKLLVSEGISPDKIEIVFDDFILNKKNMVKFSNIIHNNKYENKDPFVRISLNPYTSLKTFLLIRKNTKLDFSIIKSTELDQEIKIFKYSKYKKLILNEFLSLIIHKMKREI